MIDGTLQFITYLVDSYGPLTATLMLAVGTIVPASIAVLYIVKSKPVA